MRDFILKIFDNISLIHKFININEANAEFSRPFIVFDKFFLKHRGEMSFFNFMPRYFRWGLNHRFLMKSRLSNFNRRFSPNKLYRFSFIKNISFLLNFGFKFVYHRLFLFFGNSYYFNMNWWEKLTKLTSALADIFSWWYCSLDKKDGDYFNIIKNYPSYYSYKTFFHWDTSYNFLNMTKTFHMYFLRQNFRNNFINNFLFKSFFYLNNLNVKPYRTGIKDIFFYSFKNFPLYFQNGNYSLSALTKITSSFYV